MQYIGRKTAASIEQAKRLYRSFLQHIRRGAIVQQEHIEEAQDILPSPAADETFLKDVLNSDEFLDLKGELTRIWRKYMVESEEYAAAFTYGQIFHSLQTLEHVYAQKEKSRAVMNLRESIYPGSSSYKTLQCIRMDPGISNDHLVRQCNITKGRVSQIIKDLVEKRLITCVRAGKNNLNYITTEGVRFLETEHDHEDIYAAKSYDRSMATTCQHDERIEPSAG